MRFVEIWRSRKNPTISFELFPARDPGAQKKLDRVIDKLAALKPDFVSVTFGAGGSTREGSRQLAQVLMREKGLSVLPYFAGYGLGPDDIVAVLGAYRDMGITDMLVVRGDEPRDQPDFRPHPDSFHHASDLLAFIRPRFDFCLGAAGYPEGHKAAESREKDLEFLKLKVEQGASFIIANYFFDNRYFFDFIDRARATGIEVPIVAGVMPIFNVKMMESLARLCGATITDQVREGLAALDEGDKEALLTFGVELATRQCRELIEAGVCGIHIYTIDRSQSAARIVMRLREEGLLPAAP